MKYDFILTDQQQDIVEQHLGLVHKTIRRCIKTNEGVCGLGYDDLYQEGSIALCWAAATYDGVSAQFNTYAAALIRNHLLDQCKAVSVRQKHSCDLPIRSDCSDDEYAHSVPEPSVADKTDDLIGQLDTSALLAYCKNKYTGIARLGVEALELKVNGFSGADIARMYHTEPNHVGAWISRAKQKMKADAVFRAFCHEAVENT